MVKSLIVDNARLLRDHPELPHFENQIACFHSRYDDRSYPANESYFNRELYLILLLAGRSEVRLNGEHIELQAGTLLIHGANYLTDHLFASRDIRFITLTLSEGMRAEDSALDQTIALLLATLRRNRQYTIPLTEPETQTLRLQLEALMQLLVSDHHFLRPRLRTSCQGLFLDIADILSRKTVISRHLTHKEHILQEFHALATRHFRDQHFIRFYADQLAISEQYLSRIVREGAGRSVGQILSDLLVMEAGTLLSTTRFSVNEIALQLGFSDAPGFCKFFRRNTGKTPLGFRKESRT